MRGVSYFLVFFVQTPIALFFWYTVFSELKVDRLLWFLLATWIPLSIFNRVVSIYTARRIMDEKVDNWLKSRGGQR